MSTGTGGGGGGGKRAARAAILGAAPARRVGRQGTDVPGFEMRPNGLFRLGGRDRPDLFVCAPFDVLARTRDVDGEGHGLLLRWQDRDGVEHEWIMPFALLAGEAAEVRARLAAGGLRPMSTHQGARQALIEYLAFQQPEATARTVARVGWFFGRDGRGSAFVLPGRVFGDVPGERVLLDLPDRPPPLFRAAGTLQGWHAEVAARCVGNSRLVLAVSLAFAPALLTPLGEEGGGIQLKGGSRLGKSTALKAASSVWGRPENPDAFWRSWRATGNGVESVAAQHNDCLLPLDEIAECDPKEIGQTAYMLANGVGKTRAHRTGAARPPVTWRLLFLSTGEQTLADMLAKAGLVIHAGQEVRFVDLPADAGRGLGLFETLHTEAPIGAATAAGFAEALKGAAQAQHGTAGPAFLEWLAARMAKDPAWAARDLGPRVGDFVEEHLPDGASGQVRTVCRRFALAGVAGELATEASVTGWPLGTALDAARACFEAWCAARGSVAAREDLAAVEQVRACLAAHGQARFEIWRDRALQRDMAEGDDSLVAGADDAPPEGRIVVNRLGFRRWERDATSEGGGRWTFHFLSAGWKEATRGLDPVEAARALAELGYLRPGKRHPSRTAKLPGYPKGVKVYEVSGAILAHAEAGADEDGDGVAVG